MSGLFRIELNLGSTGTRLCDTLIVSRASILPNGHGRMAYLCEEVQAVLISHVGLFSPFWPISRSFYSPMLT
ncbi:Lipoyl synthase [Gossypium arboreum]|uniref:Lipoyl synthase n=1 Tax=Gossypium arboreum TaxID=29729 RepID=A0A0B0P9G1_GOSAR|nr:Lipoyl synthase [Gossypium arboreum]